MFSFASLNQLLSDLPPDLWARLLVAVLTTVIVALVIVANRKPLSHMMRERGDAQAVQSSHVGNPLRLGGIAIFAGLGAGILVGKWNDATMPLLLIGSAAPALLAGLWEDLGYGASPLRRLAASFVSAALAVLVLGVWVTRADLPGLDQVMAVAPVGLLLTVIVSAGFCHATNLVDGMNGLAAVIIIAAAAGLAVLAHDAGQRDLALMAATVAAAMLGFFLLNWPFGTVFMGDAGSYGVGHILIWMAFLLAESAQEVVVPALLLIVFWPLADTLHSIARRLSDRAPVFAPDRMHLHQKMRRCIEIAFLGGAHRKRSNPLATLCLAPMVVTPVIVGVILAHDARDAWIALLVFSALFAITHVMIARLAVRRRRKFRCAATACADYSEYSHAYTENGCDLTVRIYRTPGQRKWRLAIIDRDSEPVEWQATFATKHDALAEFNATVRNGTVMRLVAAGRAPG